MGHRVRGLWLTYPKGVCLCSQKKGGGAVDIPSPFVRTSFECWVTGECLPGALPAPNL